MPVVLLPDGRYLDIPDDISEEERAKLQERLAEVYPETESLQQEREEIQTTLGGHLEEVVKGIPRGLASTFLSAGEGITSLFSSGNDNAAVNWFKNIQTDLNESFLGVDEGYEDAFSAKLGAGLGSFASFFIPGAIYGKATGLGAKAMQIQDKVRLGKGVAGGMGAAEGAAQLAKLTGRASMAALPIAVPVGIAEQARNIEYARQMGEEVGIGQEIASELLGGAIGASEIYAIRGLLSNIVKGPAAYQLVPSKLRQALATGGREALQESLAGLAQDAVALGIYSDEIPIGESLFDDFTVGGAVGALSDLVFSGVMGKRTLGNTYLRKQAEEAQKEEDAKFKDLQELRDQAIEQGAVVLPAQGVPTALDQTPLLKDAVETIDTSPFADVVNKAREQARLRPNSFYGSESEGTELAISKNISDEAAQVYRAEINRLRDILISEKESRQSTEKIIEYGMYSGISMTSMSDKELYASAQEMDEMLTALPMEKIRKVKGGFSRSIGGEIYKTRAMATRAKEEDIKILKEQLFNIKLELQERKGPSEGDRPEAEAIPILETHLIQGTPEGTYSVVGAITGTPRGTFETDNEAREFALQSDKNLRNEWVNSSVKDSLLINGVYGNGTAFTLGQRVYSPLQNSFDAKVLANYDSRISKARKEQYRNAKTPFPSLYDAQKEAILQSGEFHKTANIMKDNMLRELLGPQVDAMTERQLQELRDQLDQIPNIFPIYKQSLDADGNPILGQFDPATEEDMTRGIDVTSQLGIFYDKVVKRGIEQKNFYTIAEAKKILKKQDFDQLMKEKADVTFKISEILNEYIGIRRNKKGEVDITAPALKEILDKKNIDTKINSEAFQYFSESVTGTKIYNNMSRGQKEMLLSRLATVPRFNNKQPFPDFRPRPYNSQQISNFYTNHIGERITLRQIKEEIKNKDTGEDLNQKQALKFKDDLIESGRARKVGNRLEITQDFDLVQARKANGLNETPEEFGERLATTTQLLPEEINELVEQEQVTQAEVLRPDEILRLAPPENPEKYRILLKELRSRLDAMGLKDIALKFDNALRGSMGIRQDETGRLYFQQRDRGEQAEYDRPMKTILIALEKADPDMSMTVEEFRDSISGLMDHEVMHALIDLGLLTQKEVGILKQEAYRSLGNDRVKRMKLVYPELGPAAFEEEMMAELFRKFRADPDSIGGKPKGIIQKIMNFLTTVIRTIGNGFRTPTAVLTDISEGRIGARQRGQIRSLHKLDKAKEMANASLYTPTFAVDIPDVGSRGRMAKAFADKGITRVTISDPDVGRAFNVVAEAQRGEPERQYQVFNQVAGTNMPMLVGDLVHVIAGDFDGSSLRTAERLTEKLFRKGIFEDFTRKYSETIPELNQVEGAYWSENEFTRNPETIAKGKKYADAYRNLSAYNEPQYHARELAVAYGDLDMDRAATHAQYFLDNREPFDDFWQKMRVAYKDKKGNLMQWEEVVKKMRPPPDKKHSYSQMDEAVKTLRVREKIENWYDENYKGVPLWTGVDANIADQIPTVDAMKFIEKTAPDKSYKLIAKKVRIALGKLDKNADIKSTTTLITPEVATGFEAYANRVDPDGVLKPRSMEDVIEFGSNATVRRNQKIMRDTIKSFSDPTITNGLTWTGFDPRGEQAKFNASDINKTHVFLNNISSTANGLTYRTFLHEGVHAATVPIISMASNIIKVTERMGKYDPSISEVEWLEKAFPTSVQAVKRLDRLRTKLRNHNAKKRRAVIREFDEKVKGIVREKGYRSLAEYEASPDVIDPREFIASRLNVYEAGGRNVVVPTLIGNVTLGGEEAYNIKDVTELVTFGLTDKFFQDYLESIPYRPRSKRSMWSEFVLSVRKLLGISPAVNNTAFSEILRISDDLMSVADQEIVALSQTDYFALEDLATLPVKKGAVPEGVESYIEDISYPVDESPTFSRNEDFYTDRMLSQSGIVPENILYGGKIEDAVYKMWRDTDHRPSANDIKKLYDQLKGKGSTHKNDFVDYQQLMNNIEDGLVKGLDYLWYEKWGLNIPLIVGDANMNEFSKVFGITSSQSTPEKNLKSTLGVMITAREVMRSNEIADFDATNIKKLESALIAQQTKLFLNKGKRDNLLEMYRTGQMMKTGTGQKTATMALEIMEAANNRFTPWAVLDRHMFTKFNLDPRIGRAGKGGLNITEIEYRMMQSLVGLLSTEVYRDINGFPRQLTPPQVQALLWAHERYGKDSATNPASYDSAVKFADKEIKQLEALEDQGLFNKDNPISGKFIFNPRFRSGAKKDLFDSNLAKEMYQSIVELAPSIAFEFKMGVGRGYLPEGFNVSFEEHLDYLNNLLKELTVGSQLKLLRRLGIPHEITISAGTYGKELTPNIVLRLPGADPQTVEGIAGLVTDAFLQESAVISRPESRGVHTGLTVSKPDNAKFTQEELTGLLRRFEPLVRAKQDVNFTVMASKGNSVMLIDPRSFAGDYTEENAAEFFGIIQEAIADTDYTLNTYGQDSTLIEYKKTPYTKGVSRSLRFLGDRAGLLGSSDLQRAVLSDLYVPAFQHYKRFARRHGIEPNQTLPIHSKRSALYGQITEKGILGQTTAAEWKATALAESERYPVGRVPPINDKASPTAIAVAFQLREGTRTAEEIIADLGMEEKPTFARSDSVLPSGYEQALEDIGGINQPDISFGESIVDMFAMENISSWLQRLRTNVINKYNHAEKATIKAGVNSPEARELLNHAETEPIRALLFADKGQAITAASIKYGVPIYDPIEGSTKVVDFEHGGLLEILMPLYADPEINREALLFILAVAERGTKLDENGIETPITQEVIDKAQEIKAQFPEVVSVYKKYQEWNNELIKYAVAAGMLNAELAQTWIDASIYYPFYRKMQDGDLAGPNIAHGSITATNPLAMKIKGSKEVLHPAPLETISRNANSIIQASMKNIGMAKLLTVFETAGMAERLKPGESTTGAYIVPVFIDGNKEYYRVSDPEYIYGLQVVGLSDNTGIFRFLAMSAGFLREMVTRDPGFMLVNMMRDTMSAFVTSGADFKPFIDTFKNFNADISDLERYGVAGGYDFKDDQLDIANFMKREMRKRGIAKNGGMNVTDAFVKVWDFAGEMTTRSDMSTRKGVYDVIYQQTGSQYEAAFQALEIINFARRGADPYVRIITAAIPFLNARIQGLDIIWRGGTGQYSAVRSQLEGSQKEIARQIQINMLTRGAFLMFLTAMYYAWVSDEDEYKNASLEQRDDHWIFPGIKGLPPLKIPIPFEVGTIFKVIPERIMDVMMGGEMADLVKSYKRQLRNTLKIDPLGFQAIKPFVEVMNNRSTYTGSEIIPYYMRTLEPTEQSRYGTNEFARIVGTRLGISPIKLEYLMRGYGGTLGGYLLGMTDAMLRQATGRDFLTPRIEQMPVLKRFFGTEFGGGLQQQFYELRGESDRLIQTINKMKKENRWDELQAYVANRKGLVSTRSQVLAIDRFMANWRRQRDRVLHSDLSPKVKKDIIEQMMLTRDARLMYVPELRKASDLPIRFIE